MEPVRFEEKYRQAFIDFNTDWIVTYFGKLEPHDLETFEKIDDELRMRSYPYKPLFYCPHLPNKSHKIPPDRVKYSAGRYFVSSEFIRLYPIHSFTFEGASGISVQ